MNNDDNYPPTETLLCLNRLDRQVQQRWIEILQHERVAVLLQKQNLMSHLTPPSSTQCWFEQYISELDQALLCLCHNQTRSPLLSTLL